MLHQLKTRLPVQPVAPVPICRLFRHNVESALEAVANIRQIDAPGTAIAHRLLCSFKRACSLVVPWRGSTMTLTSLASLCLVSSPCHPQIPDVLCNEGSGSFEAPFHTGVKVRVGAAKKGGLATRKD
jgi:hypothetical protein